MSRFPASLLAVVWCVSCFGCGGSDESSGTADNDTGVVDSGAAGDSAVDSAKGDTTSTTDTTTSGETSTDGASDTTATSDTTTVDSSGSDVRPDASVDTSASDTTSSDIAADGDGGKPLGSECTADPECATGLLCCAGGAAGLPKHCRMPEASTGRCPLVP